MSTIEKYISPFIAQQFPSFYRSEGENFVAFVRAYYEWLEQSTGAVGQARSLLDFLDIDQTSSDFLEHFKAQYVVNLPESVVADKRLLIKHITDLYRSKGSKRGYELLFRLAFGEDIDVYIPNEFIFKPSDNTWVIPRYLEVTSSPLNSLLIGKAIRNVDGSATAIVENYSSRVLQGRSVNVLEVSSVFGEFKVGNKIFPIVPLNGYTVEEAPTVQGSLLAIAISSGGQNYSVGDILDIAGTGVGGKAKVSSISNEFSGALNFNLLNGGSGYTLNSIVTVTTTIDLRIADLSGPGFSIGDLVVDSTTGSNGTVVFANSSLVKVINYSPNLKFTIGNTLQGTSSNAQIIAVFGGTGSGASFKVGSITNKELITLITEPLLPYLSLTLDSTGSNSYDLGLSTVVGSFAPGSTVTSSANSILIECLPTSSIQINFGDTLSNTALGISGLYAYRADESLVWCTGTEASLGSANLVSGTILVGSPSGGTIQILNRPVKETVNGAGIVASSNSTSMRLSSVNGYFVASRTITNSNAAGTAVMTSVTRLTDWGFANSISILDNLDSTIIDVTPESNFIVGTISSLTAINPGFGYTTKPFITVTESQISSLFLYDTDGSLKGNNAVVESTIAAGNGVITSVQVVDSGFGYLDRDNVQLRLVGNDIEVLGTTILAGTGKAQGRWLNRKSFTSDVTRIQDGLFFQNYSYEIIASRMLQSYEKLIRDLVHPAGIALYGRYRSIDYTVSDSLVVQSSIQQQ